MATLGQILGENKFLKLQANNKILCDVTGHEMSARADVVQGYISGKSFKKQLEWYKYDYSEFLPYIVEDKRNNKKLYCKLTKEPLNKIPEEVRKHMQGKRFKRLLLEKEAALAAQAAKPAKKVRVEESDDEASLDPRIVSELLGERSDDEEVSNKHAKKGKRTVEEADDEEEEEDDYADLLGDHSDDDGSESSEDDEGAEDFIGSEDGSIDSDEEQIIRKNAVKQASAKKAAPVKSVSAKKNAPVAKAAAPKATKTAKVVKADKKSTKPVSSKKK